jgi:hypothetical protein
MADTNEDLKQHVEGGVPANPFAEELPKAAKSLRRWPRNFTIPDRP